MKRWRWLGLLLIILLIALQAKLWLGDGGTRGIHKLRASVATQKAENAKLKRRNQALAADVKDLKHGDKAVEARARNNLGLIKPGETFYQVVSPTPPATANNADNDAGSN
ncbi:MAG TPA: cell division protein FtsB [Oleiagrimonas sp.]|nr:cell division protein FtsB [Oleiagrimonas sp.]